MTSETLAYLNGLLLGAGVNYAFARWNGEIESPYWVGEYSEIDGLHEDGMTESELILTGTSEGPWMGLQEEKERIEKLLRNRTLILASGMGVAIDFEQALVIPTESERLKRIQLNFSVKEWRNA